MPIKSPFLLPPGVALFGSLPDDARIDSRSVETLIGKSRITLWRGVKSGRYPAPVERARPGGVNRWRVGDVRAFLQRGDQA